MTTDILIIISFLCLVIFPVVCLLAVISGTKELNYACIVDVSGGSSAINKTNQLKDSLGNSYVVVKGNGSENGASSVSYTSNQYCAVSCKENWDI